jgi:hypothetical protein
VDDVITAGAIVIPPGGTIDIGDASLSVRQDVIDSILADGSAAHRRPAPRRGQRRLGRGSAYPACKAASADTAIRERCRQRRVDAFAPAERRA